MSGRLSRFVTTLAKFWLFRAGMFLPVAALFGFIALFGSWLRGWAGWLFLLVPLPLFLALSRTYFPGWALWGLGLGWLAAFPLLRYWLFRAERGKALREKLKPWLEAGGGSAAGGYRGGYQGSSYRSYSPGPSSGGGFSGGGGRFGGGGASGRW